jgi:N-acetylglucosaminyldiphosphoundecaprenol N-acetyl-beta-D-mannosaminyltransferase
VDKFAAVADRLAAECDAEIVLVGMASDEGAGVKAAMCAAPLDLIGKTSLAQLAALLKTCDLFIGADSGVMHLAAAVGTPVVAVFGPSNADAWSPWQPGGKTAVVRSAPECSPCSYVGHGIGLREGCAARTCMRMVTAEQVVAAAQAILTNTVGAGLSLRSTQPALAPNTDAWERRIRILGLPVSAITYAEWLDLIDRWVASGTAHHVCTINPEMIMIAQRDVNFRNILSRCDLTVPDGIGLLWAARHMGKPLPERVTGSDGVPLIASEAAKRGWRIYLLGAAPGVADKAAEVLRARHPALQIVGTYSGSPAPAEEDALVERINAANPDILFVAYGAPEQDKWIARNLPRLRVKMAMGVGGSLDFVAGVIPRAPMSFQRFGLEWLYRLYLQPWRIKRMMRLPLFVLNVLLRGEGKHA